MWSTYQVGPGCPNSSQRRSVPEVFDNRTLQVHSIHSAYFCDSSYWFWAICIVFVGNTCNSLSSLGITCNVEVAPVGSHQSNGAAEKTVHLVCRNQGLIALSSAEAETYAVTSGGMWRFLDVWNFFLSTLLQSNFLLTILHVDTFSDEPDVEEPHVSYGCSSEWNERSSWPVASSENVADIGTKRLAVPTMKYCGGPIDAAMNLWGKIGTGIGPAKQLTFLNLWLFLPQRLAHTNVSLSSKGRESHPHLVSHKCLTKLHAAKRPPLSTSRSKATGNKCPPK